MKNKTAFTILTILVLSFLLYLSGGIFVHHGSAKNSESIAADIDLLNQMEAKTPTDFSSRKIESFSGDLTEEQEKIIAMKDDSFDNSEMTKWFEDVIILGDSIVEGGSAYEWLTPSNFSSKIGISVCTAEEQIDAAINASPSLLFMCFGVNDIENYGSQVDGFISDYREAITKIQGATPHTVIYVNAIFPPQDGVQDRLPFYGYLDEYNTELEALCQELGVTFIDSGFILRELPELYAADGILGILLSDHAKNVSFETVQQNIVSCEGINALKKGTARDMRKNLDLDESLFDWSIYYCGNGLMDVSELLIVKSDNSAALETAEKAVASRLDA